MAADLGLADHVGVTPPAVADLPRLVATSQPPKTLAVLGASRRAVGLLEAVAARTPWRIRSASPESHDPREMTELALRPDVSAVLVGASDPPGPDERGWLDDLAGLVGAVARRRPELRVVLAGPVSDRTGWAEGFGASIESAGERVSQAPALGLRSGPDEPLREILERLLPDSTGTRHTAVRAVLSLADALDRRIEVLDIGLDGGLRAMATPGVADQGPVAVAVRTAQAALVPADVNDAAIEAVLAWTTGSLDRHRMGDRLLDLRAQPWADASGEGARLRLAAARAALSRLVARSTDIGAMASPDLTIIAGGAFAVAPARAVALAIADTVRRPGATQLAMDHARLLGPIGTIDDPDERRDLIADLADDLLAPIGSLVVVASVAASRRNAARAGRLTLDGDRHGRHELSAGEVSVRRAGAGRPRPGDARVPRRGAGRAPCEAGRGARVRRRRRAGHRSARRAASPARTARPAPRRPGRLGRARLAGRRTMSDTAMTATDAAELTVGRRLGFALLSPRTLVVSPIDAFFGLHPGDRALVKTGEAVGRGQPIVEHYRDPGRSCTGAMARPTGPGRLASAGPSRPADPTSAR